MSERSSRNLRGERRRGGASRQRVDPEALVFVVFLPDALELWHYPLGEELGRMARLLGRHVADVNAADDVADPQSPDQLFHALAHRLRAAGDDVTALVQLAPGEARRLAEIGPRHLAQELRLQRLDRAVARGIEKAGK